MEEGFTPADLDHGFFQMSRPSLKHGVAYAFAALFFLVSLGLFATSLSIPDVPRIDEADRLGTLPTDPSEYDVVPVQAGYDADEYAESAAFVIVPLRLEAGIIADEWCTWVENDDGGGSWEWGYNMVDGQPLLWVDYNGQSIPAPFSLEGSLSPEGEIYSSPCSSEWERRKGGFGLNDSENPHFMVYMLVETNPMRYQVLSVTEISGFWASAQDPQEVTQREDRGRWSLLTMGIGGLIFMYASEPSLMHDLRRMRKANWDRAKNLQSAVGVQGSEGRILQHVGLGGQPLSGEEGNPVTLPSRAVKQDWLFGAPALPASYENVFAPDGDGTLLPEHPASLGSPVPATVTPYSMGALIFALSFIWLSADLRARDGSPGHIALGWLLTAIVTVVNLIWFVHAWKQFKLVRAIQDLPTSPVRSVAVGQAEIVGQVRPSKAGTPQLSVGGKTIGGLCAWTWTSYEYVCRTDSEGNTSCSWEARDSDTGGVPFIVHDGSGGIMVDPSMWAKRPKTVDHGPVIESWQRGNWRWDLNVLGVGDPAYVLGDCVPRTHEHMEEWGRDETLANSLVMMVPSTDTGEASVLHYGTELDILSSKRSVFEILIVPCAVFLFSVFMFVNYTP